MASVRLDIRGGRCPECLRTFTVVSPGKLVLADEAGEQEFALSSSEYNPVKVLVSSEAFALAIRDPETWPCDLPKDLENIVYLDADGQRNEAVLANGCFGRCDQPEHPFMRLRSLLLELKAAHFHQCPEFLPYVCAQAPEPPPASRSLCFVCREDCR